MRLQLAVFLVFVVRSSPAVGQEAESGDVEVTSRFLVYSDDDATMVGTSIVDAEVTLPGQVEVGAHALIDAISAASVDVVSAATGRWEETRVELGGRANMNIRDVAATVGITRSQENDWRSYTAFAAGEIEFFDKNTTVAGFYGLTLNDIGRAEDPNFERSSRSHTGEFSIGQLIDPKTRAALAYSLQVLQGFQSSPYRFVRLLDGSSSPERHPDLRVRHAVSGTLVRSLTPALSARGRYRFYVDDWGIVSNTLSLRLSVELRDDLLIGLEGRAYRQSRADFYFAEYSSPYQFMSFDRELSNFWDVGGFADLSANLGPVTLDAKLGWIHYRFGNFPALPSRNALIAGGGAKLRW